MSKYINVKAFTRTGNRNENQDNYMIDRLVQFVTEDGEKSVNIEFDDNIHIIALCDGVGGVSYGSLCSMEVLNEISCCLKESNEKTSLNRLIKKILDRSNRRVIDISSQYNCQIASTISFLLWKGNKFYAANIGDSPIYLFRDNALKQISVNHTWGQVKEESGHIASLIDHNLLVNHLGRNDLNGYDMAHIYEGYFEKDDKFLICSDGLTEVLSEDMLAHCLSDEDSFTSLVNEIEKKHIVLDDNTTAMLLDLKSLKTQLFNLKISQCESDEDYKDLIIKNKEELSSWKEYISAKINTYIKENRINKYQIAEYCGVDVKTARSFYKSIPAKRDSVIILGIMLGMNAKSINYMLSHKARYNDLYPKNVEDAIWIYMIEHNVWKKGLGASIKDVFNAYKERFEQIYNEQVFVNTIVNTKNVYDLIYNQEDFDEAMKKIIPTLCTGYNNLIDMIEKRFDELKSTINSIEFVNKEKKMAQIYRRKLNELKIYHWIPSRAFLIALGIHMELNLDELNLMLEYAGMRQLYSKDIVESKIIYYLEKIYIEYCDLFFSQDNSFRIKQYNYENSETLAQIMYDFMVRDKKEYKNISYWKEIIDYL